MDGRKKLYGRVDRDADDDYCNNNDDGSRGGSGCAGDHSIIGVYMEEGYVFVVRLRGAIILPATRR